MKDEILAYLAKFPGSRKREIAGHLRVWICNDEFMNTMHELENAGTIYSIIHNDPAQMEFYDMWFIKGA